MVVLVMVVVMRAEGREAAIAVAQDGEVSVAEGMAAPMEAEEARVVMAEVARGAMMVAVAMAVVTVVVAMQVGKKEEMEKEARGEVVRAAAMAKGWMAAACSHKRVLAGMRMEICTAASSSTHSPESDERTGRYSAE